MEILDYQTKYISVWNYLEEKKKNRACLLSEENLPQNMVVDILLMALNNIPFKPIRAFQNRDGFIKYDSIVLKAFEMALEGGSLTKPNQALIESLQLEAHVIKPSQAESSMVELMHKY